MKMSSKKNCFICFSEYCISIFYKRNTCDAISPNNHNDFYFLQRWWGGGAEIATYDHFIILGFAAFAHCCSFNNEN